MICRLLSMMNVCYVVELSICSLGWSFGVWLWVVDYRWLSLFSFSPHSAPHHWIRSNETKLPRPQPHPWSIYYESYKRRDRGRAGKSYPIFSRHLAFSNLLLDCSFGQRIPHYRTWGPGVWHTTRKEHSKRWCISTHKVTGTISIIPLLRVRFVSFRSLFSPFVLSF